MCGAGGGEEGSLFLCKVLAHWISQGLQFDAVDHAFDAPEIATYVAVCGSLWQSMMVF